MLMLLVAGLLGAMAVSRLQDIAWGYLRLIGVVGLVLTAGMLAWPLVGPGSSVAARPGWAPLSLTALTAAVCAATVVAAPLLTQRPRVGRALTLLGALTGMAGAYAWSASAQPASGAAMPLWRAVIAGGQLVSAAALLGAVTSAWMLGHAYLTATAMTIAPLRRLARLFLGAVAVRFLAAAAALAALAASGELSAELSSGPSWFSWLMLTVRVGVGLVAVGVFAWMVLDCVKWRNTQSATGILYFASVLTYIGELSARYLTGELGWLV